MQLVYTKREVLFEHDHAAPDIAAGYRLAREGQRQVMHERALVQAGGEATLRAFEALERPVTQAA